jgi:arsenical-resistance protein 2
MARRDDGTPWWTDFPEPQSIAPTVEPEHVFQLLQARELSETKPRDFLLVDARRDDCTGGTIRGAMNLPAHSFYPTRKTVYDLFKQAGIKKVVFYCGESAVLKPPAKQVIVELTMPTAFPEGSSLGRGPRCAAWLQDYVDEVGGDIESQVMVGGIRGWVQAYGGTMMDGFDEKAWRSKGR